MTHHRLIQVVDHTIAILLGLVYCIIQPVMAPMVLIYCAVSYGIAKYRAIYILRPAYESGGLVRFSACGSVLSGTPHTCRRD